MDQEKASKFTWSRHPKGYMVCLVRVVSTRQSREWRAAARPGSEGIHPERRLIGHPLSIDEVEAALTKAKDLGRRPAWDRHAAAWCISDGEDAMNPLAAPKERYEIDPQGSLFLEFAHLEPDVPSILRFANNYGRLDLRPFGEDLFIALGTRFWNSERISDWVAQIYRMKWALKTWELSKSGDEVGLKRLFQFEDRTETMFFVGDPRTRPRKIPACPTLESRYPVASPHSGSEFIRRFKEDEDKVLTPFGYLYVQHMINLGLRSMDEGGGGRVGDPDAQSASTGRRNVMPALDWDGVRFHFRLQPDNLIGMLWIQFAHAVAGGKDFVNCLAPGCGKWIESGSRARGRRTKRYCDHMCRQRAYLHRHSLPQRGSRPAES